jgi:outer membrane protein assembly factor BamB
MILSRNRLRTGAAALFGIAGAITLCAVTVSRTAARPKGQDTGDSGGRITAPLAVSWRYTGVPFPNNPAAPRLSGDTAYFASGNRLYAVALSNGALRWKYPADAPFPTLITTTPAIDGDTVYMGAGDGLYAIGAADGKVRWHFFLKSAVSTSPQVRGHYVYFTADDGRFYEVDTRTGDGTTGIWHKGNRPGVEIGSDIAADLSIQGDYAYYVTSDDILHSVNLAAGAQKWYTRLDGEAQYPPVVAGELIYLATGNTIGAWRESTGQRRWIVPLPSAAAAAPAVDSDGNVYLASSERYIFALDSRGHSLWKQSPRVDFEVAAAPVLADDLLIVATTQGGVYAFDKGTGALRWNTIIRPSTLNPESMPVKANVMSSPLVANGSLYVVTDDGSLTAFRHNAIDTTPPLVKVVEPAEGAYVNGRPPFRVSAKITDDGSGVNLDTLKILLDNQMLPRRPGGIDAVEQPGYYFNPDDGTIDFETAEGDAGHSNALPDGHHSLTIMVKDWMGNQATKVTSFFTEDSLPHQKRRTGQNGNRPGRGGFPGGGGGAPGGAGIPGGGGKGG